MKTIENAVLAVLFGSVGFFFICAVAGVILKSLTV